MLEIPIIIATINRHHYLDRILAYYQKQNYDQYLIIADGSKKQWPQEADFKGKYLHLPAVSFRERLISGLEQSQSDLTVLCADDDFIVPSGIKACELYMKQNTSYSCVYGNSIKFINNGYLQFKKMNPKVNEITHELIASRIRKGFLPKYIPHVYAVHKKQNFDLVLSIKGDLFSDEEFLFCFEELLTISALINDKSLKIDHLYAVRESKNQKTYSVDEKLVNSTSAKFPTACSEIMSSNHNASNYELFKEIAANQKKYYITSINKRSKGNPIVQKKLLRIIINHIKNKFLLPRILSKKFPSLSPNEKKTLHDICKIIFESNKLYYSY